MTEIVDNSQPVEKILLIRMLSTADVCAIGLPVARYFQQQHSNAEVHFLTFGDGGRLMQLAEPNLTIHTVKKAQWPDDFFQALEAFLAIAETIVGETYTKIVNLDTTFMPCFLARFLKDAHEPVSGNYLNMSISSLLEKVQSQQLQADYVNSEQAYLDSSFTTMYKWQTQWWEFGDTPDGGYPEFYLKRCCGLVTDSLSQSINVVPDKRLTKKAKLKKVVGLCLKQADDQHSYSQTPELKKLLSQHGYEVWSEVEVNSDPNKLLKMMAASDLVVTKSAAPRWYAQAVSCPTLLISGQSEPALLMPEFATEQTPPNACDKPNELLESIDSIFEHFAEVEKGTHNG